MKYDKRPKTILKIINSELLDLLDSVLNDLNCGNAQSTNFRLI